MKSSSSPASCSISTMHCFLLAVLAGCVLGVEREEEEEEGVAVVFFFLLAFTTPLSAMEMTAD